MLNEMYGFGVRVTVVNEERVIARGVGFAVSEEEEAVMATTDCGIRRMSQRI